ncbi:GNAT family N-acetyltransferase [Paenibacillus sp. HW567]|uniref:GNAT family N-acetyltransferase n=1 Tax=Paenibacillus sp. HW567 TaxID=1034769 RepID=UPI00037B03A4|nr:GNAT family protein [Paenibacillus sp. HW567]
MSVSAMILYHNEELCVRRLELEDAGLLVKWLSDPVVLEYYEGRDRPHDLEMVLEHFYEDVPEGMTPGIVQYKSQDVGYIQFYPIEAEERQEYGYADKIVMDPQSWNRRALRVYEKNGFVRKKLLPEHEWHEGQYRDCWLIEYNGA